MLCRHEESQNVIGYLCVDRVKHLFALFLHIQQPGTVQLFEVMGQG